MPEAEWNDERTRIICELFAEQVRAGNRPNTHLNKIGYRTVASKFQQRTQLFYTKKQLKNKWERLKSDYITWKKLLIVGAGLRWDSARGTFAADDGWWQKTNAELPGARRFRNAGLQHEDKLKIMFDYIDSNGADPSLAAADGLPPDQDIPLNVADPSPAAADGLPSAQDISLNGVDHSRLTADGLPSNQDILLNVADPSAAAADFLPSAVSLNGVDHSGLAADGLPSAQGIPLNGADPSAAATDNLPSAQDISLNRADHSGVAADGLPSAQDIPLNGADHSPLAADGLPSTPDSPMNGGGDLPQAADDFPPVLYSTMNGVNLHRPPVHESVFPLNWNKKRPIHVNAAKKTKKTKTETALLMQDHLDRLVELAQKAQATFEKFTTRVDPPSASIQDVMTLVRECGAWCGSNEHFIATELFVDKEQREMFLTMETPEERFQWLRRKYIAKYLARPSVGLR